MIRQEILAKSPKLLHCCVFGEKELRSAANSVCSKMPFVDDGAELFILDETVSGAPEQPLERSCRGLICVFSTSEVPKG